LLGNVDSCSNDKTVYLNDRSVPRCPRKSWLALAMFFVYILTTSIMLINLLIAIFRSDHLFLLRVSILTRDIDIAILSVRPSVCLSVCPSVRPSVRNVPVLDENGLTYRHRFSPHGSPIILVLPASNIFTMIRPIFAPSLLFLGYSLYVVHIFK